jgi:hypothetical protein
MRPPPEVKLERDRNIQLRACSDRIGAAAVRHHLLVGQILIYLLAIFCAR